MTPQADGAATTPRSARSGSTLIAAGILLSRLSGIVREVVVNRYLGIGLARDALVVAMRIPNLLQNLLGEGSLSASFIPVYSKLLDDDDPREAGRLAGAIFGLLTVIAGLVALAFIVFSRPITNLVTFYGLSDEGLDLASSLTKVTTLGIAFLVLSAWCLGVLNAHRQFFLSYVAPVVWNVAQVGAAVAAGLAGFGNEGVARAVAWGVVAGGVLQFVVQFPAVRRAIPKLRMSLDWSGTSTRTVVSRLGPAVLGRGVIQILSFIDLGLASLLAVGGVSTLAIAQVLYLLPISLFALSIAAAELPELSTTTDNTAFVRRVQRAFAKSAFFVCFSAVAFLALGDLLIGALYERGEFTSDDGTAVWFVLCAFALALPASSSARILQNTLFARGDTKGPAQIAVARVILAVAVGVLFMFALDRISISGGAISGAGDAFGIHGPLPDALRRDDNGPVRLGAAGLALGAAAGSWLELNLLRRLAATRFDDFPSPNTAFGRLAVPAAMAFVVGAVAKLALGGLPALLAAPLALGISGLAYTVAAFRMGISEADLILRPVRRRLWR